MHLFCTNSRKNRQLDLFCAYIREGYEKKLRSFTSISKLTPPKNQRCNAIDEIKYFLWSITIFMCLRLIIYLWKYPNLRKVSPSGEQIFLIVDVCLFF